MSRVILLYLIGVAAVVTLLSFGLYRDQPIVASAAVIVALAVGLLALLPQLLSANGIRYAQHKEYFASTLLPQVGAMQLVSGDGVVLLPDRRLAWKIADQRSPKDPGMGETPFFDEMLRPHLRSSSGKEVWTNLATAWSDAEGRVTVYTQLRRRFDRAFNGKMDRLIREKFGEGFQQVWWNETARDHSVSESKYATPTYNADNFRSPCFLWYEGRYETNVGMQWAAITPVAAPEDSAQGLPWRVKVGGGEGRDYIWGGSVPQDIRQSAQSVGEILDALRSDGNLKRLYLDAKESEEDATRSLIPLGECADNAANLLRHGRDVPGTCSYCRDWSPRL